MVTCLTCFCVSLLTSFFPLLLLHPFSCPASFLCAYFSLTTSSDYCRHGYNYYGGYERGMGGRGGYADEKSYGRFGPRSAGGYQNGISGMSIISNKYNTSIFPISHKSHFSISLVLIVL